MSDETLEARVREALGNSLIHPPDDYSDIPGRVARALEAAFKALDAYSDEREDFVAAFLAAVGREP